MQKTEELEFEDDYQPQQSRRPTSFVQEIEKFLGDAWAFSLELHGLFKGRWVWVCLGVPVATIVAWLLATLWFLTPE